MSVHLYVSEKTQRTDVECIILARLGFSYEAISVRTGLSHAQIGYRLRIAGVSPTDYRKGESHLAKQVMDAAYNDSAEYFNTMQSQIMKFLKDAKGEPKSVAKPATAAA